MKKIALLLLALAIGGAARAEQPALSAGQQVYVPIYSSIFFHDNRRTLELAATLFIHNVDPGHPITVARVDYYDTKGKLIRKELDKPAELAPFETRNFVVERNDTSGGTGANFIVEWRSAEKVVAPLIEALMVGITSGQGISFTTQGKVIRDSGAKP